MNGRVEVLLVHRPRYDDWSFPKGKCDVGEPDEVCARREVDEETGLRIDLGAEIAATEYVSRGGPKRVRYWLGVAPDGEARAQNEVDEVRWLPTEEAEEMLTYERDLDVLRSALEAVD